MQPIRPVRSARGMALSVAAVFALVVGADAATVSAVGDSFTMGYGVSDGEEGVEDTDRDGRVDAAEDEPEHHSEGNESRRHASPTSTWVMANPAAMNVAVAMSDDRAMSHLWRRASRIPR